MKKAICILGMHRSGTSAVTLALREMGLSLGSEESLMRGDIHNPEGYFENRRIVDINERILSIIGRRWDTTLPIAPWSLIHHGLEPIRNVAREVFETEFESDNWLWKDPRTSILVPFWRHVLESMRVQVHYVIVYRNPLDVASSLARRDGISEERAIRIWNNYMISALRYSDGSPRVFVSYDQFLVQSQSYVKQIAKQFSMNWTDNLIDQAGTHIHTTHRHSHSSDSDLKRRLEELRNGNNLAHYELSYNVIRVLQSSDLLSSIAPVSPDFQDLLYQFYDASLGNDEIPVPQVQLFWADSNQTFDEQRSHRIEISSDGEFKCYSFYVPDGSSQLRFDPLNVPGQVEVRSITFSPSSGAPLSNGAADGFSWLTPSANTQTRIINGSLVIRTTNNDPFFVVNVVPQALSQGGVLEVCLRLSAQIPPNAMDLFKDLGDEIRCLTEASVAAQNLIKEITDELQAREIKNNELKEEIKSLQRQGQQLLLNSRELNSQLVDTREKLSIVEGKLSISEKHSRHLDSLVEDLSEAKRSLEAQLSATSELITSLTNSASWRITSPLRSLGRFIRNPSKYTRSFFCLLIRRGYTGTILGAVNMSKTDDGLWHADNDDPQLYLETPRCIGWMRLSVKISSKDIPQNAKVRLYFDRSRGYQETDSMELGIINKLLVKYIPITIDITNVRLDPADHIGSLSIEEIKWVRVSWMEILVLSLIARIRRLVLKVAKLERFAIRRFKDWKLAHGRYPKAREIPVLIRKFKYQWRIQNAHREVLSVPNGFKLEENQEPYQSWLSVNGWNNNRHIELEYRLRRLNSRPKFSIVMPVYNPPIHLLNAAIESVVGQIYHEWELCIADDHSTDPIVSETLNEWLKRDSRIQVIWRNENGNISAATNSAVELATGEFLVFLDQDDLLSNNALAEIACYVSEHPDSDFIYSDDDKIDELGNRFAPQFKPDWSPELLLSYMYFSHVKAIRAEIYRSIGGMRTGFEGSQDYDLALRAVEVSRHVGHIPKILYHWRVTQNSTASSADAKPKSIEAGRKAVQEALLRREIQAESIQPTWAIQAKVGIFEHIFPHIGPKVSILIPTRNQATVLKRCLESLSKTLYRNYEVVIINNMSDDPETLQLLSETKHKVLDIDNPAQGFSFAYINNRAAERVDSEYIVFLNNDTEVISPEWLSQMVGYAQISGVGAVGAKLLYPNETVQHAGVVHGYYHNMAGPAFKLLPAWNNGYLSYAAVTRNYSSVTAACMLTSRSLFLTVGGFDEGNFAVAYNDVDYCYRLLGMGKRIVYCPTAQLNHYEGFSRGFVDDPSEPAAFLNKYGDYKDPYYNPNLSLDNERFEIAPTAVIDAAPHPIRTLMFAFNLNWEGAPYSQFELTVRLKELGIIEPVVYCPQDGPLRAEYERHDIEVVVAPHPLQGVFTLDEFDKVIGVFGNLVRNLKVELIYANTLQTFYAIETARQLRLPAIWNPRESEPWETYFNNYGEPIASRALQCFSYPYRVVFVADATRNNFAPLNTTHNFTTIHNGLDRQRFLSNFEEFPKRVARGTLGVKDGEIVILILGTVCERKGQLDLVRALGQLPNSTARVVKCFIVGDRPSSYSEQLHHTVSQLPEHIQSTITVVPETDQTAIYYSGADIFVCTSRIESFPRVILEAMGSKLPIITTPVFGISEQVQEGVNGLFYDPGDIDKLAEHIKFLVNNKELRERMARNSPLVLETINDYDTMANAYSKVFVEAWVSGGK